MEENQSQPAQVDPPEGVYPTRVDDKGRLKLPEDFKSFLQTLPEQRFFVTTLNFKIAKVYPMDSWRASKRLLEEETDNPEAAENLLNIAAEYGATATIDGQGRILVPPDLRRLLAIENQPVAVKWSTNCVEIQSEAYRKERLEAARATNPADLAYMRRKGLK